MSIDISQDKQSSRNRWIIAGGISALIVIGILAANRFRNPGRHDMKAGAEQGVIQPAVAVHAGKVGDLAITQEAMSLAEIAIDTVQIRVVAEKLAVSGNIEAGGDRMAKITPRTSGKITALYAVVGDQVRAGQTLGILESSELASEQADYRLASARVAAAANNLERQRKLAHLGAFGQPKVQEARGAAVNTDSEVRSAESEVMSAQAGVLEAKSGVRALNAALAQAQTRAQVTEKQLQRAQALYKEDLISRQELEQTQAELETAKSDISAAEARIEEGEAKVQSARSDQATARSKLAAAVKRNRIASQTLSREEAVYKGRFLTSKEIVDAEAALRQVQIDRESAAQAVRLLGGSPGGGSSIALITPISGRIQERNASIGESVDSEHAAYGVINLGVVLAQLAVTASDLPRVRAGQRVELTSDAAPGRIFTGKVSAIGSAADEHTRTIRVQTALANADGLLRPGALVRGTIVTDVRTERATVPTSAIQEHTGKKTVYVVKPGNAGQFEVRHVKLGVSGPGWTEVKFGLVPGEKVAAAGTFYLKSEALKSALSDGCCAVPGGD